MTATGNEAVRLSQLKLATVKPEIEIPYTPAKSWDYSGLKFVEKDGTVSLSGTVYLTAGTNIGGSDFLLSFPEEYAPSSQIYIQNGEAFNVYAGNEKNPLEIDIRLRTSGQYSGQGAISFSGYGITYNATSLVIDPPITWEIAESKSAAQSEIAGSLSSVLSSSGNEAVTIDQAAMALGVTPTGSPSIGGRAITLSQLKMAYEYNPIEIVTWADGTDEQIAAMVAAADAGEIDLSDYWSAGDTRTVHLSSMSAYGGLSDTHAAQDVQFVLTDPGHYTLANGQPCNFVVLQKDCLNEYGYMNSSRTNSGGWDGCARRTWCNDTYRNAITATLRPIFKQFKTYAANGSGSTAVESTDYFALFSEKEIFGSTKYANSTAEAQNSQLTWFKTSSNRIKRMNGGVGNWWERSPCSGSSYEFCGVTYRGYAERYYANSGYGLAPFGCI